MLRKTLIALAATAAIGTAMASTAEAHHRHRHHTNIIIGLGGFGYGGGYGYGYGYGSPYYNSGYYGGDCGWRRVNVKRWSNHYHHFVIKHRKVWTCY
jgi:hypothetical protein